MKTNNAIRVLSMVVILLLSLSTAALAKTTPPISSHVAVSSQAPAPGSGRIVVASGGGANSVCTWQGNHVEWTHSAPTSRLINPDRWAPPVFCLRDTTVGSQHRLVWQNDGNLVLYMGSESSTICPLWSSHTYDMGAKTLALQSDGNIVIYDYNGYPLWNSRSVDWPRGTMWQMSVAPQYPGEMAWHERRLLPDYKTLVALWGGCP